MQSFINLELKYLESIVLLYFDVVHRFDDVLMIVQGGKTAYFGPANQAKTYFEEWGFEFIKGGNDADILMGEFLTCTYNPNLYH